MGPQGIGFHIRINIANDIGIAIGIDIGIDIQTDINIDIDVGMGISIDIDINIDIHIGIKINIDDVIGMLLAKDLLPLIQSEGDVPSTTELMRPVIAVPESKRLNVLLREFRQNRNHMAIVID